MKEYMLIKIKTLYPVILEQKMISFFEQKYPWLEIIKTVPDTPNHKLSLILSMDESLDSRDLLFYKNYFPTIFPKYFISEILYVESCELTISQDAMNHFFNSAYRAAYTVPDDLAKQLEVTSFNNSSNPTIDKDIANAFTETVYMPVSNKTATIKNKITETIVKSENDYKRLGLKIGETNPKIIQHNYDYLKHNYTDFWHSHPEIDAEYIDRILLELDTAYHNLIS